MKAAAAIYIGPVLILIASIPMALNLVPKNGFYGYRTPRTMSGSDADWYQANRTCGRALIVAEAITLLIYALLPLLPLRRELILPIRYGVFLLSIAAGVIYTAVRAG